MRSVIIRQKGNYTLTSYGNGLAYELRNDLSTKTVYVQGEDAHEFRKELEAWENKRDTEWVLGELWSQYTCGM